MVNFWKIPIHKVTEVIPALFLLSGILFACRDMMYDAAVLAGAILTGVLVILVLKISELSFGAARITRIGIYAASLLCFAVFILYVAQGFLDTVNRFMILCNLRFQTEFEQFSVNSRVAPGALVFWCLVSVPLAALLLMLVRKRSTGMLSLLVVCGMFTGFVLGRSQMWGCVACLFGGILGTFTFTSAPGRQNGFRGMLCAALTSLLFLGFFLASGGYEGLERITRWRADAVAWFERFRYGEDTLPKGDLAKASELLEKEEETLKIETDKTQEWYLKGFVGAEYDGVMWKNLPADAYQGEYEGLLKWLETKGFSALSQFAQYNALTETAEGTDVGKVKVNVENVGAYRKYVYLPSTVETWEGGGAKERKDWHVCSKSFFGADEYHFQAVNGVVSADGISGAPWTQNPSGKAEKEYLDAESVYHSFVEAYYMEVEDETKEEIEAMFFPKREEKDFNDVTAQIRKVLRRETRYMEQPPAAPAGKDFVEWFLNESHRGNAVHYASAAVLAYRTAGYPARYVEGYHYAQETDGSQGADAGSEDAEETTVVLTNKNAHAWAEVYVPGVGWMPVEVVPGMYTEMYTNEIVEGEPTFQVNADVSEDGMEIDGSSGNGEASKEETKPFFLPVRRVLALSVSGMYLCLFFYLLLEIQRIVRRIRQKRMQSREDESVFVDRYVKEMTWLLLAGKVTGNYDHPLELAAQIEEKIDGISREEYVRAVKLLQKIRFGGKKLMPYEMHTLECFMKRLAGYLTRQAGVWVKLKVRYWYALY